MTRARKPRAGVYARQSHGSTKSIGEQDAACVADIEAQGWRVVQHYADTTSASRYARQGRPGHGQLLADIEAGKLDVVVVWEPSRGDRTLATWAAFLELCRERGVLIRVTDHHTTYDMTRPRDWRTLAEDGVDSGYESEKIRQRVLRATKATAQAGRPSGGTVPYGYRRRYHPVTRELEAQEPHPQHAPIVAEIVSRIADGQTIAAVTADLNARKVPPPGAVNGAKPGSKRWYPARVRDIACNELYVGVRRHNGDRYPAVWPAIVDPERFWAAKRVLDSRAGQGWRSARAEHLLTSVVHCGVCGSGLAGARFRDRLGDRYGCRAKGCVYVPADELEELVLAYVLGRLARRDVYRQLRRAGQDADRELSAARADAAALRARLGEWQQAARRGEVTPDSFAEIERGLRADIAAADQRAERAGVPPAVRALAGAGEELPARWAAMPLAAQRDVVGALVSVTVGRGRRGVRVPVAERVSIEWKGTVDN